MASAFRHCFTAPVWTRVLVLVAGAVLAPGKRTVSQTLRVMGLAGMKMWVIGSLTGRIPGFQSTSAFREGEVR